MFVIDRLAAAVSIFLVGVYRRFLSPLKRKRCAHTVLHGRGNSCSDLALVALRTKPFLAAIRAIQGQFIACAEAKSELGKIMGRSLEEVEDAECCELMLHLKDWFAALDLGEKLAWIYSAFVFFKMFLAGLYHLGGLGIVGNFFFDLFVSNLIGAAGSALWPVVLISGGLDYLIIKGLFGEKDITAPALCQLALSILVMFLDPVIAGAVRSGQTGILAGVGQIVLMDTAENVLAAHLRVVAAVKGIPLAFSWSVVYGGLIVANYIDNWAKSDSPSE